MNGFAASKTLVLATISAGALCAGAMRAEAATYLQTDLVSDVSGLATISDPSLVNPWGVSHLPGSPFWISDQGANATTLYRVTGGTNVSKVDINSPSGFVGIPTTASGPQGPTGQVSNANTSAFDVNHGGNGASALFIFANLNGTVSAWNGASGQSAFIQATTPGAIYTGLAINQGQTMLYAANGATGGVDVFNSSFAPVNLGGGAFVTPSAISALGLVPFNVQDINGSVYVTYAPAGRPAQIAASAGMGAVAVFSETGVLDPTKTMIGGNLAAPWGVAIAPGDFGQFSGDLLVGNFSFVHSEINAFDPTTGIFEGMIPVDPGAGQTPGGLWTLEFGSGGSGSPNTLLFTDGIDGEAHGLFAAIVSVPEPSTWVMMLLGFAGLGYAGYRRARMGRAAIAVNRGVVLT
jgi:uncharacterized protein (TIGR03118 family)